MFNENIFDVSQQQSWSKYFGTLRYFSAGPIRHKQHEPWYLV